MPSARFTISTLLLLAILCSLAPPRMPAARAEGSLPAASVAASVGAEPAASTLPFAPAAAPEAPAQQPALALPAPQLEFVTGYAGQALTVRGEAPAAAPDVRLAWFYGGATRTAAIAAVADLGRYEAELVVPFDAPLGPAQVCAAPTEVEAAAFTCTDFTVTAAPPGAIVFTPPPGFLPLDGDPPHLLLLDRAGMPLADVPVVSAAPVTIPDVPVGVYQLAVVGNVNQPITVDQVVVRPAEATAAVASTVAPNALSAAVDPLTGAACDNSRSVARVGLTPSTRTSTLPELALSGLAEFPDVAAPALSYDFGVYVVGVTLKGTLEVQTQGSSTLGEGQPRYVFVSSANKQALSGSLPGGSHLFKGEIDLGAKEFTPGLWTLYVYPRNAIGQEFCPTMRQVRFVADPMKNTIFRGGERSATTWNKDTQRYEFSGVIPNFAGLPLRYPDPPPDLPLLGPLKNELEAGLFLQGAMGLDYTMTFTAVDAKTYAYLLNQPLFDKTYSIKPGWMKDLHYNPDDPSSLKIKTDLIKLVEKDWKTTVYKGVLASFWGVVTVNAAVNLGLNGRLYMEAVIYPLEPSADIIVTPSLEPWVAVSVWVDLLLGLASAGADATANLKVELPLHVNTKDSRIVYFGDPCVGLRAVLAVWARVNLYFYEKSWNLGSYDLIKYKSGGCGYPDPQPPPKPPRVLGAPAMAADTSGYMAAAYIEDTAADNSSVPIPKVMVLVKTDREKEWDFRKAVALTDGTHMVQDPAITFAHDKIIVAWTETMLSTQEERAAGNSLEAILGRQEIRYAYALAVTDSRRWSAPTSVTNDAVADGRPVLAGMSTDGATLAWVRSGGQAGYTRGSTDIAIVEYDHRANPNAVVWGERRLIAADGMDAQPALTRVIPPDGREWGRRALAFVANADGDTTGKQRRIRIFYSDVRAPSAEWHELDTSGLPPNAMAPSVSIDLAQSIWVAFLVGSPNAPGSPVDPGAQLYLARFQQGKLLAVQPVRDWKTRCEDGEPVHAEKPTIMFARGYSPVVVFRRFGAAGTNGALGQIALLKTGTWGSGCSWQYPPVYITDDKEPNWLPTAAVNALSGEVSIMRVKRSISKLAPSFGAAVARLAPASPAALPAALQSAALPGGQSAVQFLTAGEDPIVAMTLEDVADPALDPALVFAPSYAAATPVVITTTVRNLGLADTGSVTVELYRGAPPGGALVQSQVVAGPLPFGLPVEVAFEVAAGDAPEPYYVKLIPGAEGDSGEINNVALGVLNALQQPEILGIVASPRFEDAAELSIRGDGNPAVRGYRIVRAVSPLGPYELVGLAETPHFADLGLDRMQTYYYKVQSYDRQGTVSEYSLPVAAALPADQLFLPIIGR